MWSRPKWRRRSQRLILPFVTACVCAYFSHHALNGPNGWHARAERMGKLAKTEAELNALIERRDILRQRAALLNGTDIERDVLDEYARANLGLSRADEIVVMVATD